MITSQQVAAYIQYVNTIYMQRSVILTEGDSDRDSEREGRREESARDRE